MPTIASSELPVPKSWDEFEDICADLFGRIWNDHNTVRYALLGERQNGVDIRGRLPDGAIVGVQCKRKRQWPVVKLTTTDIDDEVAEALKFSPSLSEFTIATTALNAAKLQAHVDAITERHKTQGLFSVHLLGWNELWRRITDHPQLVEKHYAFVTLSSVRTRGSTRFRTRRRGSSPTIFGNGACLPARPAPARHCPTLPMRCALALLKPSNGIFSGVTRKRCSVRCFPSY